MLGDLLGLQGKVGGIVLANRLLLGLRGRLALARLESFLRALVRFPRIDIACRIISDSSFIEPDTNR